MSGSGTVTSDAFVGGAFTGGAVDIAGTLHSSASLRIGTQAYPRNMRVYVGGVDMAFTPPRSVNFESVVELAGLLYAPNGAVVSSSMLEMYGAIFAANFHNSSATRIHYDRAAASLGDDCPDAPMPPGGCTSCRDCGNQACIAGTCGACVTSADCCSPLECMGGICGHLLL